MDRVSGACHSRRRRVHCCCVALLVIGFSGCVSGGYVSGHPVPSESVARIEEGVTTRDEVLGWFGAPQHFTDATTLGRALDATGLTPEDVIGIPFSDVLVFQSVEGRFSGAIFVLYNQFTWQVAADTLVVYFDHERGALVVGGSDADPASSRSRGFHLRYIRKNSSGLRIVEPVITRLTVFRYDKRQETSDRVVVLFDKQRVVIAMGHTDGRENLDAY